MKNVCFINGSLRGKQSSSLKFLNEIDQLLSGSGLSKRFITVKAKMSAPYPDDALSAMRNADVIVMAFPLFVYSLPGALVRLLEDYWICFRNAGDRHTAARMYAIVNCAFTEPEINEDAIRVVKSFCRKLGITWRFAVSIGCGPLFQNQS